MRLSHLAVNLAIIILLASVFVGLLVAGHAALSAYQGEERTQEGGGALPAGKEVCVDGCE